jgi:hypothetical protein
MALRSFRFDNHGLSPCFFENLHLGVLIRYETFKDYHFLTVPQHGLFHSGGQRTH